MLTKEQITQNNIVTIDGRDFIVHLYLEDRPYLVTTDSRIGEYNRRTYTEPYLNYSDYVTHLRKLSKVGVGNAIFESIDELVECVNTKKYMIK